MRPGHFARENRGCRAATYADEKASMRPGHFARENAKDGPILHTDPKGLQ